MADQANRTDLALVIVAASLYKPAYVAAMLVVLPWVPTTIMFITCMALLALLVGVVLDITW